MATIGQPFYKDISSLAGLLFLVALALIFEFRLLRNIVYVLLFSFFIIWFYQDLLLIWQYTRFPWMFTGIKLVFMGLLSWLLWRQGKGIWQHITVFFWFILLATGIFVTFEVFFSLQGFFHWVQVLEFVAFSFFTLLAPLSGLVLFHWLGYRYPSFKKNK